MRNFLLLFLFAFCLQWQVSYAQNQEFPNSIYAKLNFVDFGSLYDGNLKINEGFELAYYRNVAPFLNIGVPFKLGLAKLPLTEGNTVTTSFDLVFHLENMKSESKLVPYAFGGAGYFLEGFDKGHAQFPFGVGLNFRVSKYAFVNVQGEFRKALDDNRDNVQIGVGYAFLLHKSEVKKVPPPDGDKDGTPDSLDQCPTLVGPMTTQGCPDGDNDGVTDANDDCPTEAGPATTNGCPDYDNDGIADKNDECPTEAGTLFGCPDTDNDGVADKDDQCPTVAGAFKGCPDTDADGVFDKDDLCPNEPGPASQNGCPQMVEKDSDNDGVLDSKDECPNEAGPVHGCPDSDNDGVADRDDHCPGTPGTVMGCPDSDGDGIADADDKCPQQAGLAANNGCPAVKDSDNDGVSDENDPCPDKAGTVNGCPDSDNDGVADKDDPCPKKAGTVNGCPDGDNDGIADKDDPCPDKAGTAGGCPDSDGDGISDKDDKCPAVPGIPTNNGCPPAKDTDKDGVMDDEDNCPTVAGPASNNGCPPAKTTEKDTDGDGVPDNVDKCPTTPGLTSNQGCPEVKKETKAKLEASGRAVQFETAKATLKTQSFAILDEVVTIMRQYPAYTLSISGYTDDIGDDERNLRLSQDRAKACYDYFVFRGIKAERLRFAGFGEARPIADNGTEEGRELNRRVEFELVLD